MNNLKRVILDDIKIAMKAKESFKRDTLRMLSSAIKQIEVDERRELSSEDIVKIIQKQIKQRQDAAAQYADAKRMELHNKEMSEIAIIEPYLPTQLSDAELNSAIEKIIDEVEATSMKEMGKVMGAANSKLQGIADGKRISKFVKKILQQT